MQLPYTELRAHYRVVTPFRLPHHCGSLLRGVLGRALRRTGCTHALTSCADACAHPGICAYSRLFDPPRPEPVPHKLLRGATHPPQPLLPLIPPPGGKPLERGEPFELGLRVLGPLDHEDEARLRDALEQLTTFDLGKHHGRLALDQITIPDPRNRVAVLQATLSPCRRASITFETPVWIEADRRLPVPLTPPVLVRAIYRRLCTLCALYGQLEPADDARVSRLDAVARTLQVTRHALHPLRWERHSLEHDRRHPMKGLWGTLELEGELGELAGLLRMAEQAHVGKATSHGLGRIRVALS